jgi:hypothetical protein
MSKPIGDMTMEEIEYEIDEIKRKIDAFLDQVNQAKRNPFFSVPVKVETNGQ